MIETNNGNKFAFDAIKIGTASPFYRSFRPGS